MTVEASGEVILEQIGQENLAVYTASPARLLEDVSQEAQVAHDYRGRLIYELLQNADDAFLGQASDDDRVLFRLTDTELWVANTGRAFSDDDIRGLCGLGASSKAGWEGPKRASIGHKGLGFKSVLEITEAPEAYSTTVAFQLGKVHARHAVEALWQREGRGTVKDVPAMRFPVASFEQDSAWLALRKQGYNSAFRFPFKPASPAKLRQRLAEQLLALPMSSVLFLKHVEDVIIEVEARDISESRRWLLERSRVADSGTVERCSGLTGPGLYQVDLLEEARDELHRYWVAHNSEVSIDGHREGLSGPAWDGVEIAEVSVAVRVDDDPRIPVADRRFHVFLPTQEPAACSLLVNGAFVTDLSRKHVQVSASDADYNAHLIRRAADAFRDLLLPLLLEVHGPQHVLRSLEKQPEAGGGAASLMHVQLARVLADAPLLPSRPTGKQSLRMTVLPSPVLGEHGRDFAELVTADASWQGRAFPAAEFCAGDYAAVCKDYGADALPPAATLAALATFADPNRSRAHPEADGRFLVDPVLEVSATLWEHAEPPDRDALQREARTQRVFPVHIDVDGVVERIALGKQSAFYPPKAASGDLPLLRLKFLAHAICWGSLKRSDQGRVLESQMKVWGALFDIKEFNFAAVMRAAVLPGLTRSDPDEELRTANRRLEALAAICRLAGKTTKPEQPLPLGRLGSDLPFFNLSRLEVPCRGATADDILWIPAYRVYFGTDWAGDESVEKLAEAMARAGEQLDIHFLAPPAVFQPYSATLIQTDQAVTEAGEAQAEEGDLEDDIDEALETSAEDRWRNFFGWVGVSRALRLIHFHDVDDENGWIATKGLGLPRGWAFQGLDQVWKEYIDGVSGRLRHDKRWGTTDHYLYNVHSLDRLGQVATVAERAESGVAEALFEHLARNWSAYARHTQAELALIGEGKYPSQRAKPPRAMTEELVSAGQDFWLYRLRRRAICPTSHGPRLGVECWRDSSELQRRLGSRTRRAEDFLPVLRPVAYIPEASLRPLLDALAVRGELVPTAFGVQDAADVARRIALVFGDDLSDRTLTQHIKPLYRELFTLLVGSAAENGLVLGDVPVAARTPAGLQFLPARDAIYAPVSGSRERSGVQDKLNIFVIEAEANALRPLRDLFGMPFLDEALTWTVQPVETTLSPGEQAAFRNGLRALMHPLLARLSADRPESANSDRRVLEQFVQRVEPVGELAMRVSFRGEDLGPVTNRDYYVRRATDGGRRGTELIQAYVAWSDTPWPPTVEDAQTLAMALADAVGINTVETFLSFINANDQQRRRLLDLAGAAAQLDEVILSGDTAPIDEEATPTGHAAATPQTDGRAAEPESNALTRGEPPESRLEPQKVPLYRFEDLRLHGQILRIVGEQRRGQTSPGSARVKASHEADERHAGPGQGPRAGWGTDLSELDRLGMRITLGFERARLNGSPTAVLPGNPPPNNCRNLVVDVSTPAMIDEAKKQSPLVREAFEQLGLSSLYPGFDVLTIVDGEVDRVIELKSSGFDAKLQEMSWNEWRTASSGLRHKFWLYLVGNLRADLQDAQPFIRAVHDPVGALDSSTDEAQLRRRVIQLRVREFATAEQLTLEVRQPHK